MNHKGCTIGGKHYTVYEASQLMRQLETSVRRQKDIANLAKLSGDDKLRREAQAKIVTLKAQYKAVSEASGLKQRAERMVVEGFGRKEAAEAEKGAEQHYQKWSKEIGVNSSIESLAKYYDVKYNDSPRYELLKGYAKAVKKGDISPLVGFDRYEEVGAEIQKRIVGTTTSTGITIGSFTNHFIDRIIGQTSTPHPGMRCGVSIEDALDALQNPKSVGVTRVLEDGDIRQTLAGAKADVTISIRDKRIIQTNPNGE